MQFILWLRVIVTLKMRNGIMNNTNRYIALAGTVLRLTLLPGGIPR